MMSCGVNVTILVAESDLQEYLQVVDYSLYYWLTNRR